MTLQPRPRGRRLTAGAAMLAWAALSLQLYLSIRLGSANGNGLIGSVITYFSYFTILTNILVALAFSAPLVGLSSKLSHFFMQPTVMSAMPVPSGT